MTLTQKYVALKTQVGGNREMYGYEETFGMPREEQSHVTMPNPSQRRILAEIEFAIALSDELNGKFDADVGAALDFLLDGMEKEGALTKTAAAEAEKMLLPLSPAAKEYKLIFAGHAHIDMNWMWSWHETVAATLATFRTMLDIMDEYPDFCFSQSQASVYKIVEDFDPALMSRIKERIAEGRWEITASAWVETDKNMPVGESLLRHIEYTKNYLRDSWGVDPASLKIDFSPDTFGHSFNLPEIDAQGGVDYYYHCRALNGKQALYRWRGLSGREMICYREQYWYNSGATPKPALGLIDVVRRQGGLKTGLAVYGVGDHGGGPTRRDVERIIDMAKWPVFPTIKFGTFGEFFAAAETVRDKLPLENHELNYFAPGCYTTQSRIKRGNRHSEASLLEAEAVSAFAAERAGFAIQNQAIEKAWRNVLFTHFHDILTGSCVQDSREHAMGLYSEALAVAQTQFTNAMRVISDATDTSGIDFQPDDNSQAQGAGVGYGVDRVAGIPAPERGGGLTRVFTVFNPTGVKKSEPVEITVWDWTGDMRRVGFRDGEGNPVEAQLVDHGLQQYWDHKYFRFMAYLTLEPLSYTTVVMYQREIEGLYPVYYQGDWRSSGANPNVVLENEYIRAEFSIESAALLSLTDKESGKNYVKEGEFAGITLIDTERSSSDGWNIGKYLGFHPATNLVRINGGHGGMRSGFSFETKVMTSTLRVHVSLDKGARTLKYAIEADWNDPAGEKVPVLAFVMPAANDGEPKYRYNIPCGMIDRGAVEQDVPGQSYGAELIGDKAVAIITDSKYGYRGRGDGKLISTLINSTAGPDPYPERGIHHINLFVGVLPQCPKVLAETAESVCRPMTYTSAKKHTGTLPLCGSFFTYDAKGAVLSSVGFADGAAVLRFYSVADCESDISVTFGKPVRRAEFVDVMGCGTGDCDAEGATAAFTIGAYEVKTVKAYL